MVEYYQGNQAADFKRTVVPNTADSSLIKETLSETTTQQSQLQAELIFKIAR